MIPDDPVDFLLSLSRSEYLGMKPGLERIRELLEKLDHPEAAFNSVLIGGTNGKGSTSVILASLLARVAGKDGKPLRLGLYLSPHLVNLEERILVGGKPVSREQIRETARKLLPSFANLSDIALAKSEATEGSARRKLGGGATAFSRGAPPAEKAEAGRDRWTFFEFITAIAFACFRDEKVDLAVTEVGLGGRLDATNVLSPPVSIITNISLEHTEWLGKTDREIAREKSGIIREGGVVVTGAEGEAREEIHRIAGQKGAKMLSLGRDFAVARAKSGGFDYQGLSLDLKGLPLSGRGDYQFRNAALALAGLEVLAGRMNFQPREKEIRAGLDSFTIPGRLQIVEKEAPIVLDGAHNPGAARVLSEELKSMFPGRKARIIFAAMRDKEVDKILEQVLPLASRMILADLGGKRALAPAELEKIIRDKSADLDLEKADGVKAALDLAREGIREGEYVLVTGSLYLVGEALRALELPGYVRIN
ncbi:MAG: bifunctional folylpolyglutamate synthase/dihydrofolate synthase [Proteobacteria bacterium]|nr:bifunctional folylpolyglutamate synthase/dihydrofolate synthase [Pseudomonadota bacterium]